MDGQQARPYKPRHTRTSTIMCSNDGARHWQDLVLKQTVSGILVEQPAHFRLILDLIYTDAIHALWIHNGSKNDGDTLGGFLRPIRDVSFHDRAFLRRHIEVERGSGILGL